MIKRFLLNPKIARIILFIRKTFGLTDLLTFLRHAIISVYCWILSPIIFQHLDGLLSGIVMFIFTIIVTGIFLKISSGKTEKSTLLWLVNWVFKENKLLTTIILFILEPFLFIVYYRDNYYYQYKNTISRKIYFCLLLLTSSFMAIALWTIFIYFFGQSILNFLHLLSGINL